MWITRFVATTIATGVAFTTLATPPATASPSTTVVVAAIATRGPSGDRHEGVDLANISFGTQSIGGWHLVLCSATGNTQLTVTIPAGTALSPMFFPGSRYLILNQADPWAALADQTYPGDLADTGGAALYDTANNRVDAVGMLAGGNCTEGAPAVPQVPGTDPTLLTCDANVRKRQGIVDTDNNLNDFEHSPRPWLC